MAHSSNQGGSGCFEEIFVCSKCSSFDGWWRICCRLTNDCDREQRSHDQHAKVAEAYTAETGVALNWVALEEGVLREQVTSDTATGGGQYDIINIGMQEAPIWGAAGWIEPLNFGADYDMDDILPASRRLVTRRYNVCCTILRESSMVMYRKDLTDAAGVAVRDNDSWANIKGAAAAMHDPDNGVYGACLRGKPGEVTTWRSSPLL